MPDMGETYLRHAMVLTFFKPLLSFRVAGCDRFVPEPRHKTEEICNAWHTHILLAGLCSGFHGC